ncbi:MAG: response regulator [Gemmatimonadetes bacterium]|nr:MAG: response regulator [Gemmatimonadota bacterium]
MKILIVEDHRITARLIQSIVKRLNYTVLDTVTTGKEMIEQTRILKPDLVLADVELAGEIDGITAAKQIYPTPVIFLTANPERKELHGFTALKKKGFEIEELRTAMEKATRL